MLLFIENLLVTLIGMLLFGAALGAMGAVVSTALLIDFSTWLWSPIVVATAFGAAVGFNHARQTW